MSKSRMIRAVLAGIALGCVSHAAFASPIFSPHGQVYPDGSESYLRPEQSELIETPGHVFGYVDEFFIRDFRLVNYAVPGGDGIQTMTASFFAEFRSTPGGTVEGSVNLPGTFVVAIDGRPGVNDAGVFSAATRVARFEGPIAQGLNMIVDLDPNFSDPTGVLSITPIVGGTGYLFDVPVEFVVHGTYCVYTDGNAGDCANLPGDGDVVGPLRHGVPAPATSALILLGLLAGRGLRRRLAGLEVQG